jgi:hypothetical protein
MGWVRGGKGRNQSPVHRVRGITRVNSDGHRCATVQSALGSGPFYSWTAYMKQITHEQGSMAMLGAAEAAAGGTFCMSDVQCECCVRYDAGTLEQQGGGRTCYRAT